MQAEDGERPSWSKPHGTTITPNTKQRNRCGEGQLRLAKASDLALLRLECPMFLDQSFSNFNVYPTTQGYCQNADSDSLGLEARASAFLTSFQVVPMHCSPTSAGIPTGDLTTRHGVSSF